MRDGSDAAAATPEGGEFADHLRRVFERGGGALPATLGLIGSSRDDGNTGALMRAVFRPLVDARVADLGDFFVGPYDYAYGNAGDDFLPLAHAMTKARVIVFASPVYWYSMSAQMKAFFDRLTDLTETHKAWGKSLAGKTAFLVATGGAPAPHPAFEPPFAETAHYFDMHWGGALYQQRAARDCAVIDAFAAQIAHAAADAF
jgi:multimeric flavodoxin WrbA